MNFGEMLAALAVAGLVFYVVTRPPAAIAPGNFLALPPAPSPYQPSGPLSSLLQMPTTQPACLAAGMCWNTNTAGQSFCDMPAAWGCTMPKAIPLASLGYYRRRA